MMIPRANLFALLAALQLLAAVPVAAQEGAVRIGPDMDSIIYGVYCAQDPIREDPAPDTVNGHINIVPAVPDFQFRQKVVPAQIGIGFGIVSRATMGITHDPVTITVTHPPFPGSGVEVESYQSDIDDGTNLTGFSFDHPHELVLGPWTFTANTTDGTELFYVEFEVVAPELMPQVISACFEAFMS